MGNLSRGSSLPTDERTRRKNDLEPKFESIPLYNKAKDIYKALLAEETFLDELTRIKFCIYTCKLDVLFI